MSWSGLRRIGEAAVAFCVVVLLVGTTVWLVVDRGLNDDESADSASPLVTVRVERRTLRDVVVIRGSLRGRGLPSLVATGAGLVTAVRAQVGAAVRPGDVLYDVEAEPVVAVSGAFPYWRPLDRGVVGADVRQLELLLEAEGLAPGTVDDRFTGSTQRAVREWQRRHGLPATGVFRSDRVLVAAWPTRVTAVNVAVGKALAPDQEVLGIETIQRVGSFSVSPTSRSGLRAGQPVTVSVATGGHKVEGKIADVAAAPVQDEGTNALMYPVTVTLDEDNPDIPNGAAVRGDVVVAEAKDALVVPVAAVRTAAAGGPVVEVAGESGHMVAVGLGLQEGGFVEVLSGLKGTERVVLRLR